MRLLPRRGGGRGRRIKGPKLVHVRRPVTLYGVRSPVRIGPRRRRRIPRLRRRHRGHLFRGVAAALKILKAQHKKSSVHQGGRLLHRLRRHRLRRLRLHHARVHRLRNHTTRASFRIAATLKAPKIRYRIKAYRPPKPPNEMPDIKAAIKGGFKP